ncbi:MAG TPA: peptide ABC transporter substrate-binding protein, partial [Pseudoneobacillus sp.]|nr:peptide ABC transporter substrate-binding protein [Pseudoneobacillus sp.]
MTVIVEKFTKDVPNSAQETLLEVKNLKKYYPIKKGIISRTVGHVKAVDGLNFSIKKG